MDVVLPAAGEVTSLLDRGRRQRSFIDTSPRRLEATRERHERKAVTIRYDASRHELRIQLPRTLDAELFGEGEYTLEVLRGTLNSPSGIRTLAQPVGPPPLTWEPRRQ